MKARGNTRSILKKVEAIQILIGRADAGYMNDRSSDRAEKVRESLKKAHELCIEIRGMYDPL